MRITACALACAAICGGCAASSSPESAFQEYPKDRRAPLSEYEATLNPVDFDKEINRTVVKHQPSDTPSVRTPSVQAAVLPHDSMAVQEEVVQGFRIQIHSSSNLDEANEVKGLAQQKFAGDSIYIVYDSPVYKVRVGDFVSRYDASQRLSQFIDLGYRDAWIVPDRIIQRTLVPVKVPSKP